MAANNILPFAQAGGALVQSTATYSADAQRTLGNQPGVARPDFVNKALKQATAIVAGLAQFLADNQSTDVTDDLLAAAISTMMTAATKAAAQSPAGTIVWIPGTSPLANTVKINGSLLTRVTYPKLWAYAQASGNLAASDGAWLSGQFSPGDGTTTFRVPDLRGYLLRAWDDARGVDPGRGMGTVQADSLLTHNHGVSDPTHAHTAIVSDPTHVHSYLNAGGGSSPPQANASTNTGGITNTGSSATGISVGLVAAATGISIANYPGTAENRVKNIALMPIIYY